MSWTCHLLHIQCVHTCHRSTLRPYVRPPPPLPPTHPCRCCACVRAGPQVPRQQGQQGHGGRTPSRWTRTSAYAVTPSTQPMTANWAMCSLAPQYRVRRVGALVGSAHVQGALCVGGVCHIQAVLGWMKQQACVTQGASCTTSTTHSLSSRPGVLGVPVPLLLLSWLLLSWCCRSGEHRQLPREH